MATDALSAYAAPVLRACMLLVGVGMGHMIKDGRLCPTSAPTRAPPVLVPLLLQVMHGIRWKISGANNSRTVLKPDGSPLGFLFSMGMSLVRLLRGMRAASTLVLIIRRE